jgi:hypothetical protein
MKKVFFKFTFIIVLLISCTNKNELPTNLDTEIRNITEISSYRHLYRDIVYLKEKKTVIGIPVVDKSVLFSVNIEVTAGIKVNTAEYSISEETIIVKLPPAQIISIDADEQSIQQYFIKEKGSKIDILSCYAEIAAQKDKIAKDAVSKGILVNAETNAKMILTEFLQSAGFREVLFETDKIRTKDNQTEKSEKTETS